MGLYLCFEPLCGILSRGCSEDYLLQKTIGAEIVYEKDIYIGSSVSNYGILSGCKTEEKDPPIIGGADAPTTIILESEEDKKEREESLADRITEEQALAAVKNYCYKIILT